MSASSTITAEIESDSGRVMREALIGDSLVIGRAATADIQLTDVQLNVASDAARFAKPAPAVVKPAGAGR